MLRARWMLLVIGGCCWLQELAAAEPEPLRPNILLIISDDQGYSDLGCIGRKPVKTPHLDRLAREGVRATNYYAAWPACTPSRGSLLTGRYPQRNGLYDMIRNDMVNYFHHYTEAEYAISPEMTLGLDVRERTLGDLLRRAGYRTGMVGKWDMGQARRFLPLQRGFDFFYGHGNNGIDYYTHERYGVPSMFSGNERTDADRGQYATDLFRREASRFIGETSDSPWFLYLAFNAPHSASTFQENVKKPKVGEPAQAPESFVAPYRALGLEEPLARYYGAVTCMDAAIGGLLAQIERQGQAENTLVIFMSDNGGSGNGGNPPLRSGKSTMWEGGLRSPLLVWWPKQLPANRVTDEFLTSLEWFPTLARIAGVEPEAGVILDGFDMWPVLRGQQPSPRREMCWEWASREMRACRVGSWKWVESNKGSGLFDLSTDLAEEHDLSREQPGILTMVKEHFATWKRAMDASEWRGPFRAE